MSGALADNYQPFDGALAFGRRPALLMIDFAQAYFDPACGLYAGVEDARASALRLRAAARQASVPRIFTRVVYRPDGADGGVFFKKIPLLRHFIAGDPMGDWAEGCAPEDDEIVIEKRYPSAFFGTALAPMLTALAVDCVLIAGLSTSGCVRATAVDACSHGFAPFVVRQACGDRHPAPHEANLFDIAAKYGEVIDEAAAIAALQRA
ncbi:MAG: isochorismatase family protein [Hyphomonadaceae bacterium]|nr:isochorismatase family protein [Hyphomonadaceae bacterium]